MRLRRHAAAFYGYRPKQRRRQIRKYNRGASSSARTSLRKRAAAHVAGWIAYHPKGHIPGADQLLLLARYLDSLGRLIPLRLQEVLPKTQVVILAVPRHRVNEHWQRALLKLQQSLQRFRRCRWPAELAAASRANPGVKFGVAQPSCIVKAVAALATPPGEVQNAKARNTAPQHLRLFRRMNQWGLLDGKQRLEHISELEAAAKQARDSQDQAELTEVVCKAAAALSAPRRQVMQQHDEETHCLGEAGGGPESMVDKDVQQRVRRLLLDVLCCWQSLHFDSHTIQEVLEYIQTKLQKFEDNVGELKSAAAGGVWSSIKQAVEDLLYRTDGHHCVRSCSSVARLCIPKANSEVTVLDEGSDVQDYIRKQVPSGGRGFRRLERQSGIPGISWKRSSSCWVLDVRRAGVKRKAICFPLSHLLRQGMTEEDAVQATLKEAKTRREELVRQGMLKPAKPRSSSVMGVTYHKTKRKWQVQFKLPGMNKHAFLGVYTTQAEAEAKAIEMAKKLDKREEVVPVPKVSDLPYFEPLGPQKGVKWNRGEQCWHAQHYVRGKNRNMRFQPKDAVPLFSYECFGFCHTNH